MAGKRTPPETTAGARRRKRAAPTIDLTATEVPQAAAAAQPEPPRPPQPPEPPSFSGDPSPAPDFPPPAADQVHWFSASTLAAGVAGAAVTALVMFTLWLTGLVPIRYAGSTAMRARVTGLEMQMRDLQKRPAGALDTKPIDALNERIGKLETAMTKLPAGDAGLAERVAAADSAMKALGVALATLNRRSDDIAANADKARNSAEAAEAAEKAAAELRTNVQQLINDAAKNVAAGIPAAELDGLQKRIAALEQSAKLAREDIAKSAAKTTATDAPARLALSAAALRAAVLAGAPFAAELAQVKSLGADDKTLTPLAPFAATGVPTAQALAEALRAMLPRLHKVSSAPAPSGGFLDRLQANAGKLVRIRPVDAPPGDDAPALLARIEAAANHADIAAALADLGKLPEAARAPAQDWIAQARNRQAALAAARQFAADAARALGQQ